MAIKDGVMGACDQERSLSRSRIYQAISDARASLAEPSRPFTPADPSRKLFRGGDSFSRPTSSFTIGSSAFGASDAFGRSAVPQPKHIDGAEVLGLQSDAEVLEVHQAAWWASVESSLCELHPNAPVATLLRACDRLWDALRECGVAGPLGVAVPPPSELGRRSRRLVGGATALMDRKEGPLLLRLARLVLLLSDAPHTQAQVCRLLFKLSKAETHDGDFRELGLLPMLLDAAVGAQQPPPGGSGSGSSKTGGMAVGAARLTLEEQLGFTSEAGGGAGTTAGVGGKDMHDAALYAAAALKNVSADAQNQRALAELCAVPRCAAHLQRLLPLLRPPSASGSNSAPGSGMFGKSKGKEGAGGAPRHGASQQLLQLTGCLRNLAAQPGAAARRTFVGCGCIEALCGVLRVAPTHLELCINACRVLSKLTLYDDVRARIHADDAHLSALLAVLAAHSAHDTLLVRCCFILANLTSAHEPTRVAIAEAAAPRLLDMLATRTAAFIAAGEAGDGAPAVAPAPAAAVSAATTAGGAAPPQETTSPPPTGNSGSGMGSGESQSPPAPAGAPSAAAAFSGGSGGGAAGGGRVAGASEELDVLVKLGRLVAHLAISPQVGPQLAASPQAEALLDLLDHLTQLQQKQQPERQGGGGGGLDVHREELMLNAVSAVTNLSYYLGDNALLARPERLVQTLVPVLMYAPNPEAMAEAARAYGNLSRDGDARALLCAARVHDALVLLLEHPWPQVVEASCGVLVNLAADAPRAAQLLSPRCDAANALGALLLHVLSDAAAEGATMGIALLAGKTMCNLCCFAPDGRSPLGAAQHAALLDALCWPAETVGMPGGAGTNAANRLRAPPAAWSAAAAVSAAADGRAEWLQVAGVLSGLLIKHAPPDDADGGDDAPSPDDLEELPVPPLPQVHACSVAIGTDD